MSLEAWIIFALFCAVFVTAPGLNAVNCVTNGQRQSFQRPLPGVAAILTQAALFPTFSALGVTALITALASCLFINRVLLGSSIAPPGRV